MWRHWDWWRAHGATSEHCVTCSRELPCIVWTCLLPLHPSWKLPLFPLFTLAYSQLEYIQVLQESSRGLCLWSAWFLALWRFVSWACVCFSFHYEHVQLIAHCRIWTAFFVCFFVPTGLHFQVLFVLLRITCSCAYFWSRTSIDLLCSVDFYFSWVDPAASRMGVHSILVEGVFMLIK